MKNLTRREAVKTGAAIAAVGATATLGLPSVAEAGNQDAEFLARVAEFYRAFEKHNIASEASKARRAEAEAMPDCPPFATPASDKAASDRWDAFMKAKGVWKLSDKSNAAGRAMGKAAKRVFAIPAHTYRGVAEKVKIAYLATGDGDSRPPRSSGSRNRRRGTVRPRGGILPGAGKTQRRVRSMARPPGRGRRDAGLSAARHTR